MHSPCMRNSLHSVFHSKVCQWPSCLGLSCELRDLLFRVEPRETLLERRSRDKRVGSCTVTPLSEIQHETLTREAEHKTQTWEWMLTGYLVMFHLNLHVTTTIKIRMFVNMESMLWTVMV